MPVAVHVVDHPLIADSLTRVRDISTPNALFRQELERIGLLLIGEATRGLPTHAVTVQTPLTETLGRQLTNQPVVVPVLRAGLGFLHAAQELLPNADVGFIGVARDENTHMPKPYVNKLPESLAGRQVIVLDPMLATGGSLIATIDLLKRNGCQHIKAVVMVAAPEGVKAVNEAHPDVQIVAASLDSHLNEHGYIIPGLGDAGDKIFGTKHA